MKFIRLFESFGKKSIVETCDDILIDLRDEGYQVDVTIDGIASFNNKVAPDSIAVSVSKCQENTSNVNRTRRINSASPVFLADPIMVVINRVEEYLKSEGYSLERPLRVVTNGMLFPLDSIVGMKISGVGFVFNKI